MSRVGLREFKELFKKGTRRRCRYYSLFFMPYGERVVRVSAKKKVGSACVRNKEKRLARFFLRKMEFTSASFFVLVICQERFDDSFLNKKRFFESFVRHGVSV